MDAFGMPKDWPFDQLKMKRKDRATMLDHKTKVGRYEVSTCELGIMRGMGDTHPYETMVFDDVTGETDVRRQYCKRHQTVEEAEAWHSYVVGCMRVEVDALKIMKRES